MDIAQVVMLVLGAVGLVVGPIRVVRAVRRKDFPEVFDVLLSMAVTAILVTNAFWPNAIHAAPRSVRWLSIAVLVLWIANWCGLSGWLFRREKNTYAQRLR